MDPDIAAAVLSGGATLPQLALKAVADATGQDIQDEVAMGRAIESASPETMLKVQQGNNSFKIRMAELGNELTATELGDVQHAREQHKHSFMPAMICIFLSVTLSAFAAALMIIEIPTENVRMLDTIFGSYLTAWIAAITYWVGTTRSSAEKTKMIGG